MNGHIIGSKPIYVSWAMNKEDRKDQIAQQSFWRGVSGLRVQKVNYPKALKFITWNKDYHSMIESKSVKLKYPTLVFFYEFKSTNCLAIFALVEISFLMNLCRVAWCLTWGILIHADFGSLECLSCCGCLLLGVWLIIQIHQSTLFNVSYVEKSGMWYNLIYHLPLAWILTLQTFKIVMNMYTFYLFSVFATKSFWNFIKDQTGFRFRKVQKTQKFVRNRFYKVIY